uniref:Importin N-terminal domain-containing protein n=2 Tax=Ditylum brightwellii TaxID=49249 RepID=A0A7S2EV97_9STRA
MTEAIMTIILSRNKKVQIAACSAFGVLVESTGELMVPYLEPVYRTLVQALSVYQTKSLKILFDTLGTMADFVGPSIGEGSLPSLYVPPLLALWNELARANPFDRTLLPLMESLSSTALTCGMNFQPWALETFELAMTMIESCTMILAGAEDEIDDEEADPIVCAADLLDGLVEGFGENFGALVSSSTRFAEYFPTVLHMLTSHDVPGVRMSAFALLGDLARQCPTVIQTALPMLLSEAILCMEPMHESVCNNAVWAVGEVCAKCVDNSGALAPYAEAILEKLIPLLMGNAVDDDGQIIGNVAGLSENAAAAVGRLAKCNAEFVTKDLERFLMGWCGGMAKISDKTERRDAFEGFILAIRAKPQCIQPTASDIGDTITSILFAVVTWHLPEDNLGPQLLSGPYSFTPFPQEYAELGQALISLLHDLKSSVGNEKWNHIEGIMPVNVRKLMREVYHL